MRRLLAVSLIALAAACGKKAEKSEAPALEVAESKAAAAPIPVLHVAPTADLAALAAMRAQFARIEMAPDVSFLTEEEKKVVNLLSEAGRLMSEIYMRQRSEKNPTLRAEIAASDHPDKDLLLDLFDLNYGVWDEVDHHKPFYGAAEMPAGAGFYPADMTKEEFEKWVADHPDDKEAFNSPYTVIRREGD
jgi:hypothetical protein